MKQQIRRGVFETNSSSEHSVSITTNLVILTDEEYAAFKAGNLKVSIDGKLTPSEVFLPEIEKVKEEAGKEWDDCPDNEIPKVHRKYCPHYTREYHINERVERYQWTIDATLDEHVSIEHKERVIDGKTLHALSLSTAEVEDEDY